MNNSYIKVCVEGKNINNYVKWLFKQKISILNLNILCHNKLEVIVYYKHYKLLKKYSHTYKITVLKQYGYMRFVKIIKKNTAMILATILAIIFMYFLSNIIFSIDVISNDKDLIINLQKELQKYGIQKYKFKKNYKHLTKIEETILEDNKDKIEWLEIIEEGTKYIIKLVERKQVPKSEEFEFQSISASKNAIITSINASSGEKIREINDYVKTGDIIVSGVINKPTGEKIYTKANAIIYGNVWYKIDVEYPIVYKEEKTTGKSKETFVINFLTKKIPIFPYKKYKDFQLETNKIIENNILPISISKEKQYEVLIKEEIYTWEETISNAISEAKNKLLKGNKKIKKVMQVETLNKQIVGSKIKLTLFFSVEEDITNILEIKKSNVEP